MTVQALSQYTLDSLMTPPQNPDSRQSVAETPFHLMTKPVAGCLQAGV